MKTRTQPESRSWPRENAARRSRNQSGARPVPGRSGLAAKKSWGFFDVSLRAELLRAGTARALKPTGTSMFKVRGWMLNVAVALCLFSAGTALAGVHYVDLNSTNATPPYLTWATAATSIQDAVDAAVAGDEIVVTNGMYASGGRAASADSTPNRVAVDKPLIVRSINGSQFTTINGDYSVVWPV